MTTIAGVDCTDGVLLAGDRAVVTGRTITGSRRHVYDLDGVGAAAVGDDPTTFRRRLDVALEGFRTERGDPGIEAVARLAADVAAEAGVVALVAAAGVDDTARLRSIDDAVLDERVAARGSGARIVLGHLEGRDRMTVDSVEPVVREAFEAAASRDAETSEDLDVLRLPDADADAGKTL